MSFPKALVVVQLLLLLVFTVVAKEIIVPPIPYLANAPLHPPPPAMPPHPHHHHHRGYPPTHAPTPTPQPHPGHHHHHPHPPMHSPPARAPVHPPMPHGPHLPAHPPTLPPSHPPAFHFPRSLIAVEGVVYCKPCKYAGVGTLLGASPIKGAMVQVRCNSSRHPTQVNATTDEHGYFLIRVPNTITNYGFHKCNASLAASQNASCSIPTNLHGGVTGGLLRPQKQFWINKLRYGLFDVGPFAFEPKCPH